MQIVVLTRNLSYYAVRRFLNIRKLLRSRIFYKVLYPFKLKQFGILKSFFFFRRIFFQHLVYTKPSCYIISTELYGQNILTDYQFHWMPTHSRSYLSSKVPRIKSITKLMLQHFSIRNFFFSRRCRWSSFAWWLREISFVIYCLCKNWILSDCLCMKTPIGNQ